MDPSPEDITIYTTKNHEESDEIVQLLGEQGILAMASTSFEGVDPASLEQDFSSLPSSVSVPASDLEKAKQILKDHGKEINVTSSP